MIEEKIEAIKLQVEEFSLKTSADLEEFKRKFTGKNGVIASLFETFKTIPGDQKKTAGQLINNLKNFANQKFDEASEAIQSSTKKEAIDTSLPGKGFEAGSRHPLNVVNEEVIAIFERIGFNVKTGPEAEEDWFNFTALNFPDEHPARDMQDTFFVDEAEKILLRTHTSSVQVRTMLKEKPPIRIISPGRVYRNDSDATHSPVFHQIEGLYIAENVSFSDLKNTLFYFVKAFFGENVKVRFRPSFFPFTEPSAEMDIEWIVNGESKWMEILGCGMVDPNVLENCGIDSKKYTGFAFGMGVERLTMLRHKIRDIRLFYENDVRFLKQF